jgi:hypothetical protein
MMPNDDCADIACPNTLTSQILPGALRFPDKLTPSPAYRLAVGTPMYDRIAFRAVFRVIHPAVPQTNLQFAFLFWGRRSSNLDAQDLEPAS